MSAPSAAGGHRNRLAGEASLYLRQHATNPVDWYPWGPEALARARDEHKPILLSIGYSACHWCHVMAHECFEDAEVAALMNRLYINIKVDREERPDLDQIYQAVHQLFTQRAGGWPLTIFLTPQQVPFFSGTYFPKHPRHGLPGFLSLLERAAAYCAENDEEIRARGQAVQAALSEFDGAGRADQAGQATLSAAALERALATLKTHFDATNGGFGDAPKFPQPAELRFVLRRALVNDDAQARHMVLHTLARMDDGGVRDQLGGGFFRYAVDAHWGIPHFEQMLYDNAALLQLHADAWCVQPDADLAHAAAGIADWLMHAMQLADGGYCASVDADSAQGEGRFYVWSREEVSALLSADEYAVVTAHYGLDGAPNFEGRWWHLRVVRPLAEVAEQLRLSEALCGERLAAARAKLLAARAQRAAPARDDKVLTGWNALAIGAMARAATVYARADWLASARRALDFIRRTLWRDGRLLACAVDGQARLDAYLDDHAFLLAALLEMLQADYRSEDLDFAQALADALLARFEDGEADGFYFTSHDHETLFHRPKPWQDGATPAGNGMAALALQRLGHLIGETRYLDAAARTLRAGAALFERGSAGLTTLLMALEEWLEPPTTVVLRGEAATLAQWRKTLLTTCQPATLVIAPPVDDARVQAGPSAASPAHGACAWVCRGTQCLPPIVTLAALRAVLRGEQIE